MYTKSFFFVVKKGDFITILFVTSELLRLMYMCTYVCKGTGFSLPANISVQEKV